MRGSLSLLFAVVVACALGTVSVARADDAYVVHSTLDATPTSASNVETRWYGWQNMIVDGASIGLFVSALKQQSPTWAWTGVAGMAFGSAVVHGAHDNPGRAAASIGLRAALPTLGYLIGNAASCGGGHEDSLGSCEWMPQVAGIAVGALVAMAIDDAVLAHEEVKKTQENVLVPSASITPSRDGNSKTFSLGVAGTF